MFCQIIVWRWKERKFATESNNLWWRFWSIFCTRVDPVPMKPVWLWPSAFFFWLTFRTLHQKDFLDYEFVTKEYPRVYFPNLLLEFYVNQPWSFDGKLIMGLSANWWRIQDSLWVYGPSTKGTNITVCQFFRKKTIKSWKSWFSGRGDSNRMCLIIRDGPKRFGTRCLCTFIISRPFQNAVIVGKLFITKLCHNVFL